MSFDAQLSEEIVELVTWRWTWRVTYMLMDIFSRLISEFFSKLSLNSDFTEIILLYSAWNMHIFQYLIFYIRVFGGQNKKHFIISPSIFNPELLMPFYNCAYIEVPAWAATVTNVYKNLLSSKTTRSVTGYFYFISYGNM